MGKATKLVFQTKKRIKLGIWGLGRGMSFYKTCAALNIDVIAGCDYNEHMRANFLSQNPGAFATADADEFLKQDLDAVLLATFCPAHAGDAIRCMAAGKHVLSEVTSFHTMAEGVRLVEAVEKSGLVYNLSENYPFTEANMYLARKWKEGLFGELMYAEFDYLHECRPLCYTYIDGVPVKPGWSVHNWRSWLNEHYYCTHSLGPIMVITGTRPVQVEALPSPMALAGHVTKNNLEGMGGVAPSLIRMSNGGLVRNLMGSSTSDSHMQRLWGTLGAAEQGCGNGLQLRLGGSGGSPKFQVKPTADALGKLAAKTGHGGGDFWVLYYFARQVLTGERAPFDIYGACDVTIPGILAFRSANENGKPYDVPDFRKKKERDAWRNDTWAQKRYDVKNGCFPKGADQALIGRFTKVIKDLIAHSLTYRAYSDWRKVKDDMASPAEVGVLAWNLMSVLDDLKTTYAEARKLADAYPKSDGARVLREMLELGGEAEVQKPAFKAELKRRLGNNTPAKLWKGTMTPLQPPLRDMRAAKFPGRGLNWAGMPYNIEFGMLDARAEVEEKDGFVYIRGVLTHKTAGCGELLMGADGPFRVWLNGKVVGAVPVKGNPCTADEFRYPVKWKKGANQVVVALGSNKGAAWGITVRGI